MELHVDSWKDSTWSASLTMSDDKGESQEDIDGQVHGENLTAQGNDEGGTPYTFSAIRQANGNLQVTHSDFPGATITLEPLRPVTSSNSPRNEASFVIRRPEIENYTVNYSMIPVRSNGIENRYEGSVAGHPVEIVENARFSSCDIYIYLGTPNARPYALFYVNTSAANLRFTKTQPPRSVTVYCNGLVMSGSFKINP